MTLFKQVNMIKDLPLDGEKDVVLVMRENEGEHDFMLHLPPFKGENKKFPPYIATAVTIAACLYENDEEFQNFIAAKFKQYDLIDYLDVESAVSYTHLTLPTIYSV